MGNQNEGNPPCLVVPAVALVAGLLCAGVAIGITLAIPFLFQFPGPVQHALITVSKSVSWLANTVVSLAAGYVTGVLVSRGKVLCAGIVGVIYYFVALAVSTSYWLLKVAPMHVSLADYLRYPRVPMLAAYFVVTVIICASGGWLAGIRQSRKRERFY